MICRALTLGAFVLAMQSACSWPEHGRGGMAETAQPDAERSARIVCARKRLEIVRQANAVTYLPADFDRAEQTWIRAARAEAGGFNGEAARDLHELHDQIDDLAKALREKDVANAGEALATEKVQRCTI
jgi:hypothetical protein